MLGYNSTMRLWGVAQPLITDRHDFTSYIYRTQYRTIEPHYKVDIGHIFSKRGVEENNNKRNQLTQALDRRVAYKVLYLGIYSTEVQYLISNILLSISALLGQKE